MYLSNHRIHFVFDSPDDCHYTDSLLRLSPEAFLWFELNRSDRAQLVLSISMRGNELWVRTFDTASADFLKLKRGLFGMAPKTLPWGTVNDRTVNSQSQRLAEQAHLSEFLTWLRDCAESNDKYLIALLIAHDAVPALLQTGSLQALPKNCSVLVNLPADAEQLERCLLKEQELCDAFPELKKALSYSSSSLMSALKLALNEQLVCLHDQPEDMENLLLLHAARTGSCYSTPEQLLDQARCLHLLRKHRRLYLLSERFSDSPACYPQLAALDGQLEALYPRLLARVRDLQEKYPEHTAAQALRLEGLVPKVSWDNRCDSDLDFTDSLAVKLFRLRKELRSGLIPRELRDEDCSHLANLSTLWNKPRSQVVLEGADDFCDGALDAIVQKRWDDVKTSLYLLRFCSDQVCACQEQTDNLNEVLKLGREVLSISANIAAAGRLNDTFMDMAVPTVSSMEHVVAYQNMLHKAAMREDLTQDQLALVTKRLLLQQKVASFYRSNTTPAELAGTLAEIQRSYEQTLSQAKQTRTAAQAVPQVSSQKAAAEMLQSVHVAIREPAPAPVPEPVHRAKRENSHEDDVRISRQLLYNSGMPGGYVPDEEELDDDDICVEDA